MPARGGIRDSHRVRGSNLPRPQLLCRQLGKPHASRRGGIPTVRKGDGAGGMRGRRKRRPPCNGADRAAVRRRYPARKGADVFPRGEGQGTCLSSTEACQAVRGYDHRASGSGAAVGKARCIPSRETRFEFHVGSDLLDDDSTNPTSLGIHRKCSPILNVFGITVTLIRGFSQMIKLISTSG